MTGISFTEFLSRRGYDLRRGSGQFLKRMFLESWIQPGFHRFWRVWNPLYGYFLYLLYLLLRGNRNRILATLFVFASCGFLLHDVLAWAITGYWSLTCTFGFLFFGVFALFNRALEQILHQDQWPALANAAMNIFLIVASLLAGVWLSHTLLSYW